MSRASYSVATRDNDPCVGACLPNAAAWSHFASERQLDIPLVSDVAPMNQVVFTDAINDQSLGTGS
jgi:hypothetical protein